MKRKTTETATAMASARLASLGRAVIEMRRGGAASPAALEQDWRELLSTVPDDGRDALRQDVETLLASGTAVRPVSAGAPELSSKGTVQELMQRCASLELKLKTEATRYAELNKTLQTEKDNHAQAVESLSLQQRKIKELQDGRGQLLEDVSRLEAQLRLQINETEQVQVKYDKLKASRSSIGEQVTGQTEQINALQAENERLRAQVEETLRTGSKQTAKAQAAAEAAESRSAEAVLAALWQQMHEEVPDVFLETHVPNAQTFERACDAFVELVRVFATLERHVHQMLRDLRQVGEEDDKLTRFYIILTKNPGLVDTLREYLASGRGRGNFANLLRAVQAWARALGTGLYKVIVKSPGLVTEQLNYRNWPTARGRFETEEASIGKYFKETAYRSIPEVLGTTFRKQAGDMAYEDYNTLMRQQR